MDSILQRIKTKAELKTALEKLERIKRLSKYSPLEIGKIIEDTKKKSETEEFPLWYQLKKEILEMKVGPQYAVTLSLKYWREIGTAMDDIFENPDRKRDFTVSFPKMQDGSKAVKITRKRG